MHTTQEKLLALAQTQNLGDFSYYSLAKKLKAGHHNNIKYHLNQLIKQGVLVKNRQTGAIFKTDTQVSKPIMHIPIYGQANCGEALQFAEDSIKGYLKLSPSALQTKNIENIYALKAVGNSLNKANVAGKTIADGDYVLVCPIESEIRTGDYVVSLFDSLVNIKKIYFDLENKRFVLVSESTERLDPIIIAEEDFEMYKPIGKVVEVIKGLGKVTYGNTI